jgi:ATP-binding protein involved in chromosome partitioning
MAGLLLNRAFGELDWGELEWLIVDLPPGTADVQQHLAHQLGIDGAVLVVTPQDVAHLDAKKVHTMMSGAKVPVLGGVENMAPFTCASCGNAIELFPPTPHERSIWALGITRLACIPFTAQLAQAAAEGRPRRRTSWLLCLPQQSTIGTAGSSTSKSVRSELMTVA